MENKIEYEYTDGTTSADFDRNKTFFGIRIYEEDEKHHFTLAPHDLCSGQDWYDSKTECEKNHVRMPFKHECQIIYDNKEKINEMLETARGEPFDKEKYYWSSSEYVTNHAWVFCTDAGASQGGVLYRHKFNYYSANVVRPVLASC